MTRCKEKKTVLTSAESAERIDQIYGCAELDEEIVLAEEDRSRAMLPNKRDRGGSAGVNEHARSLVQHYLGPTALPSSDAYGVYVSREDGGRSRTPSPEHLPQVVAVGDEAGYWASGIIIGRRYVLTAGHVHSLGGRARVYVGREVPDELICKRKRSEVEKLSEQEYHVENGMRHPRFWDAPFFLNDLAILKVERDFPETSWRRTVRASLDEFKKAKWGIVVGYGGSAKVKRDAVGLRSQEYGRRYGERRVVDVDIIHEELIALDRWFHDIWGYQHDLEFIAADAVNKEKDACTGDSGGAFFVWVNEEPEKGCKLWRAIAPRLKGSNGTWKLAGMVSRQFGLGGESCGAGTIYVNLFEAPGEAGGGGGGHRQSGRPNSHWPCVEAMVKFLEGTLREDEMLKSCTTGRGYRDSSPRLGRGKGGYIQSFRNTPWNYVPLSELDG